MIRKSVIPGGICKQGLASIIAKAAISGWMRGFCFVLMKYGPVVCVKSLNLET